MNAFMSMLAAGRLRREAARMAGGGVVADLGAGPGCTAREACRGTAGLVVLVDASGSMLSRARALLEEACPGSHLEVVGLFESLPLPSCSVDSVTATFSIRDALDRENAIAEIARILKPRGRLVIVDLYRPSNPLALLAARLHLLLAPTLGAILTGCPQRVSEYLGLGETVRCMDTLAGMKSLLARYFDEVKCLRPLPATGMWIAEYPRVGCGSSGG